MVRLTDAHRLLIVTGKGGVGKSLLAAALARRSAAAGRRTVLVTLDTRDERHPLLGVPLRYKPQPTEHGFAVSRVDAFEAAGEYARRTLPFGAAYQTFFSSRAFRDFAAAAPGFEDLMCLGKLYNLAVETDYQCVVFDAPATGHLRDLLAVPRVTQRAVRVGPLNHNARKIEDLLLDPDRTQLLVATLAEELPVREALELLELAHAMRIGVGPVLVNRRLPPRMSSLERDAIEAAALQARLSPAGVALAASGRDEYVSRQAQEEALAPFAARREVVIQIPRIVQRHHNSAALVAEVAACLDGRPRARIPRTHDGDRPTGAAQPGSEAEVGASTSATPDRTSSPALDLPAALAAKRILVCCGSGGVGKTTSAAALGVLAARQGLKVQVMTIDPARRLAQAMGLDELSHEAQRVPLEASGELWAMMLDSKHAFDELVATYAPSARVRDAIFANQYYQQLSTHLGGSRELMAMEQVLETAQTGRYDLLIVDTPPSQHALDFLDAPERIVNLLDGSMTSLLVRPYGFAARAQFNLFRQSSALALKFMERFTGVQMLAELSDFLLAFSSMFDGFKERSHRVQALMREPSTAFLLVCAPEPGSLRQAGQFAARLGRDRLHIVGVLANKVAPEPPGGPVADAIEPLLEEADLAVLAAAGDPAFSADPLPERLASGWREARDLHLADREALAAVGGLPMHVVPRFTRDLHSMPDLERFAGMLAPS